MRSPGWQTIAKWAVALLMVILTPGIVVAFLAQFSQFLGITVQGAIPDIVSIIEGLRIFSRQLGFVFLVGGALGLILSTKGEEVPKLDSVVWYVHVVAHELVHAVLAKLCRYEIREMKFTRHGGYVAYRKANARGNFLISLGPYLFPLIPILLTIVAALFRGTAQGVAVFFLGVSLGWHVAETAAEALNQYDVQQVGRLFSVMLILFVNVGLIVLVMAVVAPGKASFGRFLADAWELNAWYLSVLVAVFGRALRL